MHIVLRLLNLGMRIGRVRGRSGATLILQIGAVCYCARLGVSVACKLSVEGLNCLLDRVCLWDKREVCCV